MTPPTPTTVHHLEMRSREAFRPSAARAGFKVALIDPPDPERNREFYCAVGAPWKWQDRLPWTESDWQRHSCRDALSTYIGRVHGCEVGYFELEAQDRGSIEILSFGLLPDCIGQGFGGALLSAAVACAWEIPETRRVWLHTCSHDHQHALGNYGARGFEVFKTVHEQA